MRCSQFASTLFSVAIVLGTMGIALANSRSGAIAELGAHPNIWAVSGFESFKEWHTFKLMDEMFNNRAKNSLLLPLPYKIALAQAGLFTAKYGDFDKTETLKLNSIFSPKMLALLSTRWANKNLGEAALDRTANNSTAESSNAMARNTSAVNVFSETDWQFGDWATSYFSQPVDFNTFVGVDILKQAQSTAEKTETTTPNAASKDSAPTDDAKSGNHNDKQQSNDSVTFFWEDNGTYAFSDAGAKYAPQNNGSFGYPIHFRKGMIQGYATVAEAVAIWHSRLPEIQSVLNARQLAHEGYIKEHYSAKYGNAVETGSKTELHAVPPRSDSSKRSVDALENYYYWSNNKLFSLLSSNSRDVSPDFTSMDPLRINWDSRYFGTVYCRKSISVKTIPNALLGHFTSYFRIETGRWTGAIRHIAVQYSMLREVF